MSDTLSHSHMLHFLKRNIATCSYAEALSHMFLKCKTESVFVMAHISQLNAGPLCSYYFRKFKYLSGKTLILRGLIKDLILKVDLGNGSSNVLIIITAAVQDLQIFIQWANAGEATGNPQWQLEKIRGGLDIGSICHRPNSGYTTLSFTPNSGTQWRGTHLLTHMLLIKATEWVTRQCTSYRHFNSE